MHILNRLVVAVIMLAFCVPLYGAFASDVTKEELTSQLEQIMEDAKESYRSARGVRESRLLNQGYIDELEAKLKAAAKARRVLRKRVGYLRTQLAGVQVRSSGATIALRQTEKELALEKTQFRTFVRLTHVRQISADAGHKNQTVKLLFAHVLGDSLADTVGEDLRSDALKNVRAELLVSLEAKSAELDVLLSSLASVEKGFIERLAEAEVELEQNYKEYKDTVKKIAIAKDEVELTQEQKDEERAIMNEVSAEVLRIQAALRRIDERMARKAERDLIRLKLFDPRPGEHANYEMPTVDGFVWPVSGPISAGFRDSKYVKRFGFNHNAIDIVVRQGTPVRAAADGVVFKTRDGGAKGFSYILLGHAGGLTTLYGHMFQMIVAEGSDVKQGQIIGYSGGTPGTWGAGPYTTGAHLHFQVSQDGGFVNPLLYLP